MVSVEVVIMISSSGVANTVVSVVVLEMTAPLQKDVVWLVLSRSVTVLVVVTWPLLFALAPGSSFHFAPPIAVRLVSKRNQLWHRRHSRPNKLRLFMVSEPTQAKPTTQTISSRSVQLASLDRPDAKLDPIF